MKKGVKANSRWYLDINFFDLPKSKRSQVTIFIIIGIAVLAIGGTALYVQSQPKLDDNYFQSAEIKTQTDSIQNSIMDCLKEVSADATILIGAQGGYFKRPEKALDVEEIFVPYYYYKGEFLMPTNEQVEEELATYVNLNLRSCFEDINKNEFKLEYKNLKASSEIKETKINFNYQGSIKIIKEKKYTLFELENHPVNINSPLSDILEIADYITEYHKEDPAMTCINCVGVYADEKDVLVEFFRFEDKSTLVVISKNQTDQAREETYNFQFLNQYTGDEVSPDDIIGEDAPPAPE